MTSYIICRKRLGIKKSDIELLKKSVEDRKLEYFKSELLKILDKKEKEESGEEVSKALVVQDLYKSMIDPLYMAKGGKVDACTNSQELLNLVLENRDRFCDELGRPLPIVQELSKYVSKKNDELEALPTGRNQKEHYADQKALKRRNAEAYNKKRAEHIRQDVELNKVSYNQELLSRKAAEKIIAEYKNKKLTNKETSLNANYGSEGAGKLVSQKAVNKSVRNGFTEEEHFTIASHIKEIFEEANLISIEPDRDSDLNDNVKEVRRYATEFDLNGKKGFALMTVKLNKDETNKMYALELNYLTNKKPVTSGEVKDNSNHATLTKDKSRRPQASKDNIAQDYNDVNKKNKDSERAEVVKKHIEDKMNEYMNDSYTKSSAYGFVKKYGKARLEKIADGKIKSDEEYKKWLNDRIADIEKESGENVSDYTIDTAIWKHCVAVFEREAAREKLKSMDANEKEPDLPVDEKDMQEAKNIIGADVKRILDGKDTYGNAKQTLTDKIKRRIRNNPGVARAMLVYIKQEQEKTGKKVYTEKHSIWEELPKLNENAKEALKNGESETKTGVSGNLYEGEDGTTVVENKDWGRYQISFPGKPDSETISMLKHNGFRWSPSTKTWVCFNTANGEYSLKRVAEKLGLKKTGGIQKSFASKVNELKKSYFDNIGA